MANEIITTAITTFYRVDLNDNLYIAPTGSIRTTSGTAALANTTTADVGIDIVVDGSLIAMTGPAISLISSSSATSGFDTILIGAGGLLRSVSGDGVFVSRSNEIVTNHGSIFANPSSESGVRIAGNLSTVNNTGTISAGIAVDLNGSSNSLSNSGLLHGRIGVQLVGAVTTLANTGDIQAEDQAAVIQTGFTTGRLFNSGQIGSTLGDAIQAASTFTTATFDLTNHGQIVSGGGFAFRIGFTTASGSIDTSLSVVNSGEMTGALGGILIEGKVRNFEMRITNSETGIISTPSKNAAIQFTGFLQLVNDGLISSNAAFTFDDATLQAAGTSASLRLVNRGTILSHGEAINMNTDQLTSGSLTLRNLGDILGEVIGGSGGDLVTNRGTLANLSLGAGNDVVRNFGVINGDLNFGDAVSLGDGNNLFDSRQGTVEGRVFGGFANDTIMGGAGDDAFFGFSGDDLLLGGAGNDVLIGGLGSDRVNGGAGDDLIKADFDFDTPTGGAASPDFLIGGEGADIFEFRNADYIGNTAATRDRIVDFAAGTDRLDFSDFMAGGSFIGSVVFASSGLAQVRYAVGSGILLGDVNGDTVADWQVGIAANLTLTAADFIF